MEEARKEHFVGPIARAMYTFERVMVIVSTILTLCTLCMMLYNYILADVLELRSATREDWSAPGLDRVEADAETGGDWAWGLNNTNLQMLDNGEVFDLVTTKFQINYSAFDFAKTCDFIGAVNKAQFEHFHPGGWFDFLYLRPVATYVDPVMAGSMNVSALRGKLVICFHIQATAKESYHGYGEEVVIAFIFVMGFMISIIELADYFAPLEHPLHNFQSIIKRQSREACDGCCLRPCCRCCCCCWLAKQRKTLLYTSEESKKNEKPIDFTTNMQNWAKWGFCKRWYHIHFSKLLTLYESPVLLPEKGVAADEIPCRHCKCKHSLSEIQEVHVKNLDLECPDDTSVLKLSLHCSPGAKVLHLAGAKDRAGINAFQISLVLEQRNDIARREELYSSFLLYVMITVVFNVVVSSVTKPKMDLLGNEDVMTTDYEGQGLWTTTGAGFFTFCAMVFMPYFVLIVLVPLILPWKFNPCAKATCCTRSSNFFYGLLFIGVVSFFMKLFAAMEGFYFDWGEMFDLIVGYSIDWSNFRIPAVQLGTVVCIFFAGLCRFFAFVLKIARRTFVSVRHCSFRKCARPKIHTEPKTEIKATEMVTSKVDEKIGEKQDEILQRAIVYADKKLASESETQLNKEKEQEREAEEIERKARGGEPKQIELKFPTSISEDSLILGKNAWGIVPSPALIGNIICTSSDPNNLRTEVGTFSSPVLYAPGWTITEVKLKYRYAVSNIENVSPYKIPPALRRCPLRCPGGYYRFSDPDSMIPSYFFHYFDYYYVDDKCDTFFQLIANIESKFELTEKNHVISAEEDE